MELRNSVPQRFELLYVALTEDMTIKRIGKPENAKRHGIGDPVSITNARATCTREEIDVNSFIPHFFHRRREEARIALDEPILLESPVTCDWSLQAIILDIFVRKHD